MSRRIRWATWLASAGCLLALAALGALTAQALPVGKLTQLGGLPGCVSETGSGGTCVNGKALETAQSVTVSPDGKHVYVAAETTDAVAAFTRNATSGQLTQLSGVGGCVSEDGTFGQCANGKALDGAQSVAVSPDGKHVYVTSIRTDAVAAFRRNVTSGQLTQLAGLAGCVSEDGTAGQCADGKALENPESIVLSEDGKNAYIASDSSDAVAAFKRNATSGQLTQLTGLAGCVSETGTLGACTDGKALDNPQSVALSPDDKHAYVVSEASSAVAAFVRNATTGRLTQLAALSGCVSEDGTGGLCTDGKALSNPFSVAASADGKSVYVASLFSDAVAAFSRNATSGRLTQLAGLGGCVSEDGSGGLCANGKALSLPVAVTVSPDSKSVYVGSSFFNAVAAFARNVTSGVLTQLAGTAGCVSETGNGGMCLNGKALESPASIALNADSKNAYVASSLSSAVAVFKRDTAP